MTEWKPIQRNSFLEVLKRKKQDLQRQQKLMMETDLERSETLLYRIELLNLLITEFQGLYHINSIRNLKHRARF